MEDTGLICFLIAHHVCAPAQECPKVHVGVGRVGDHAMPRRGDVGAGRQQGRRQGVVEGPGEGVCRRVTLNTAADRHGFVFRHSVNNILGFITNWSI